MILLININYGNLPQKLWQFLLESMALSSRDRHPNDETTIVNVLRKRVNQIRKSGQPFPDEQVNLFSTQTHENVKKLHVTRHIKHLVKVWNRCIIIIYNIYIIYYNKIIILLTYNHLSFYGNSNLLKDLNVTCDMWLCSIMRIV